MTLPQQGKGVQDRARVQTARDRLARLADFQEAAPRPKQGLSPLKIRPEQGPVPRPEPLSPPKRPLVDTEAPPRDTRPERVDRNAAPARPRETGSATPERDTSSGPGALPRGDQTVARKGQGQTLSSREPSTPLRAAVVQAAPASEPTPLVETPSETPAGATIPAEKTGSIAPNTPLDPTQLEVLTAPPATWQEQIQTHLYIQGGMDALLQNSPVLALLSGHLEQLVPSEIPTIVAEHSLLQKVIASGDLESLFSDIQSLEQQLKDLGLENTPLAVSLDALGRDSWGVSLKDLLRAIGLDPDRLMQEAARLKQVLPDQGLQPYMIKAAKLRAQMDNGQLAGMAALGWPQPGSPRELAVMTPEPHAPLREASLRPAAQERSLLPTDRAGATLWGASEDGLWLGAFAADDTSLSMPSSDLQDALATPDPLTARPGDARPDSAMTPEGLPSAGARGELLLARLETQDPFERLADGWKQEDVKTIDFSRLRTEAPSAPSSRDMLMTMMEGQENSVASMPSSRQAESARPTLPLQAMASLMDLEADGRQESSFDSQSGNGSSFSDSPAPSTFSTPQPTSSAGAGSTFQLQQTAAPAAPLRLPQEALQQIFDRASMMVKEGGGSIRVDLGSDELGTIDLALDIQGDSIDLRISASSPHARDLLAQELPRLRESLQQQNLNLERVEVGLSGGSAWTQSGDGRSSRGQIFEQLQENTFRGPGGVRDVRSYRQSSRLERQTLDPQHAGMIQVRV
jgi:hypothetical protein